MNKISIIILVILILGFILFSFLGNKQQYGSMLEGFEANNTSEKLSSKSQTPTPTSALTSSIPKSSIPKSSATTTDSTVSTQPGYDNYNHYDKSATPTMFYGPHGTSAKIMNTQGKYVIIVSDKQGKAITYHPKVASQQDTDNDNKVYHSPSGGVAVVYTSPTTNEKIIKVTDVSGNTIIYSSTSTQTYDTTIDNPAPTTSSDDYTADNYNLAYASGYANGIIKSYVNGPGGNVPAYSTPSSTSTNTSTSTSTSTSLNASGKYNSSLPTGIPKSMIPPGNEDLYILKTEVVPPICAPCPPQIVTCPANDTSKCPPCAPCARCPEPSFNCQKVPNYSAGQDNPYLPIPVLSSFSSFGM